MRILALSLVSALFASVLFAELEPLPYAKSSPGYHDATVALAEYCLENKLYSEAVTLCETVTGDPAARAREIIAACDNKDDVYTAESWGGYLDRREMVQRRRAVGAADAGVDARQVLQLDPDHAASRETLGHKWLDGVGWLSNAEHERLAPCVVALQDEMSKPAREATWESPWVIVGERFTLVTDLAFKRAVKYAGKLERFDGVFFETLGDVIPRRRMPNVVWCCKDADTFVDFTKTMGFPMTEEHGGLHVGVLGAVIINAERCDYVGRKNKSHDNLARTLYHECAHRLVETGLRGRRGSWESYAMSMTREHAWIVESVAIIFEDLRVSSDSHRLKGLEDQRIWTIHKHWKKKKNVPGLHAVFKQGHAAFARGEPVPSTQKYALAGAVGWYCLFEKPADYRAAFLSLLVDYYRTDTGRKDFDKRFGTALKDFEDEWREWVLAL